MLAQAQPETLGTLELYPVIAGGKETESKSRHIDVGVTDRSSPRILGRKELRITSCCQQLLGFFLGRLWGAAMRKGTDHGLRLGQRGSVGTYYTVHPSSNENHKVL